MGNRAPCPFTETAVRRLLRAIEGAGKEAHCLCLDLERRTICAILDKDAAVTITGSDLKTITEEELRKLI